MIGLVIEFSLVVAGFVIVWRRQLRERHRARERASQLDFDFLGGSRSEDSSAPNHPA